MGKSRTQNESGIDKQIASYGYDRVAEWTKKQLRELQALSSEPICLELANGNYIVATYSVIKLETEWQVENEKFSSKRSAIFYATLLHVGKELEARELVALDSRISVLESDKSFYRNRLDQAHLQSDQFKIDLYASRFVEIKNKLTQAKNELNKICVEHKYNNRKIP